MKTRIFSFIIFIMVLNLASLATVVNNTDIEDGITKNEKGIYEEDYLFVGKTLNFSGETEDLIFVGKELKQSGKTKLGLISIGKDIWVKGSVGNGIIAGCENLTIKDTITGTNFFGCKEFELDKKAVINGDVFGGAGNINIDGTINGNVYLGAGKININGVINGDVKAYGGRIIIEDNGQINGNLTYGTKEKLSEKELAKVTGDIRFDDTKKFKDAKEFPKEIVAFFGLLFVMIMFLSFIASGSILLTFPVFRGIEKKRTEKTYLHTALWGLIPIFMYPALIVAFILAGITIPFAIILMLAAIPLFFIAHIIGTTMLGQYLAMKFNWKVEKRHYHFLIGAGIGLVLSIIPIIDALAFLIISGLGWGMYISVIFNKKIEA